LASVAFSAPAAALWSDEKSGCAKYRLGGQHNGFKRAFVDQPVHHAGADARLERGLALAPHHAIGEEFEHAAARFGHTLRRRAGKTHADALALGTQVLAHAQAHAQHHAARAQRVVRDPIDEATQFGPQWRQFEFFLDVFQAIVEARIGLRIFRPHHRGRLAGAKRHRHDVAGRERKLVRHPVGIGPIEGDRNEDIDDALGHAGILGRFLTV
jgi:hypothetical protein